MFRNFFSAPAFEVRISITSLPKDDGSSSKHDIVLCKSGVPPALDFNGDFPLVFGEAITEAFLWQVSD